MDDLESEWEIKESSTGKRGWMMRLGRKILVTGIVISSAPLVIPPIMAISAIGFVCSVPYGVFLVSYACTKTLMSRLLPMPSSPAPLLLEYDKAFRGEVEELKEDRIELVDKGNEELDKGDILQKDVYRENGVENDENNSVEQVGEFLEEDNGGFMNERPSKSFEEVKEITGFKAEQQPSIEESWNEQPGDEGHGTEAVVEGDAKHRSNIEKETPLGSENVEEKDELVRETRQSVENVDVPRKRKKKKTKSKSEGTTKGKGEQSIKGSVNEQQGDEKGREDVNKQKNDELVRNSRGSLERNRKVGTSCDVGEVGLGVEKDEVNAEVKISEGDEGMTRRKQERLIEESLAKQPVDDKVIGALGGLERSEKKNKEQLLIEESLAAQPVDDKVIGALGGLEGSEKKDKEQRLIEESLAKQPVDDKVIGALGGLVGSGKDKETPLDGSMSEQPMEEVCNIVVEFEGDEKNGTNIDNETPFQMEKIDVHLSQSTDNEEDKELVRETRGLLEKIRDEGKTGYVDDKLVTEKVHVGTEKEDVIFSNEDEREINEEQGLDLLENLSTVSLQGSPPEVNTEESRPSSSGYSVHQEASDSSDLPVSTRAQEADDIRISTENAVDAASDEAIQCEGKIWEQMNALRTIVGYQAARKETCIEELKALYLFTGIDPPASLKDTCDLTEVDAKLGFLKSVVGVK